MTFVPLRVRSHGSLLRGTAAPRALVERALELGYEALALTDRDNLYLAVDFLVRARAAGLAPLAGAEVTARPAAAPAAGSRDPGALLIALDRRGYANLCAVLSARHLDPDFDLARALGERHAGLHVVVESPGLAAALLAIGVPAAEGHARAGARAGGLWLGVRGSAAERGAAGGAALAARVVAARRLGLPLVATGDVTMLGPDDWDAHRVAVTAAAGELLERMPPTAFATRDAWLTDPAEWVRRVRAVCAAARAPEAADEALANNAALAARCHLEIAMGVPIFPRAPLPDGRSGAGELRLRAEAGIAARYGRPGAATRSARARLDEEIAVIKRLGFTDYFLLVAGIVAFAQARGIPMMGRGSGASSIIAYLLGITDVDPLRHGLCFERFLHPQRRDCPDLDIDLCWRRRDEVIAHVYEAYGRDRVAMIATHATLGARSAFRETAKALGVANARVNELAKRIPRELEPPYLERLERLPGAGHVPWREPPLAAALRLAERLDGAPRHLSVHCGGLVIADRPLTDYVPLERAAKDVVVTQFEMRAIERIGLVKMDLLGNRALSTIAECASLVRARETAPTCETPEGEGGGSRGHARLRNPAPARSCSAGSSILAPPASARSRGTLPPHPPAPFDPDTIPEDDPATAARVAAGDTLNCFQLESPAMRHLLRMLRARTLEDTIAAVALVRPGPAGAPVPAPGAAPGAVQSMKEAFCRRHRGLEPDVFLHPALAPVLAATHGVMLYEEDVMRVAAALAGLTLAEGDDLRRAIGAARGEEEFRALERGFVAQAVAGGVAAEAARAAWRDLARFAGYAFCKAHAAGYGALGWRSAWYKTHFPVEWAASVLNHHAGMYETWVHVEDLRRGTRGGGSGVRFLPPCVNRSAWETTLEEACPGGCDPPHVDESHGVGGAGGLIGHARLRSPAPARSCSAGSAILAAPASARSLGGLPLPPRPQGAPAVRVGLGRVFGLAEATGARIVAERARRPFRTLADFVDRVRPTPPELESLVLAGALDGTGRTRPSLLLEARLGAVSRARGGARAPALVAPDGTDLAPDPVPPVAAPDLPEFDAAERVRGEWHATGLWFSAHPLDVLACPAAPGPGAPDVLPAAAVAGHVGRRVAVVGLSCARRRVETRSGGTMLFLTLADRSGLVECALFPGAYRAHAEAARARIVRVEGRVDETLDAVTITVERATALA